MPFGTGEPTTIHALADAVLSAVERVTASQSTSAVTPRPCAVKADVSVNSGDFGRVCDTTASAALGWRAAVSLSEGIQGVCVRVSVSV